MRSPQDARMQNMMKLLDQFQLTDRQLADAEDYLAGKKGDEILQELPQQNLSNYKDSSVFYSLMKHGKTEEAGRLFNILFAIGGASSYQLFPQDYGREGFMENLWNLPVNPAKAGVICAMSIGSYNYLISSFGIQKLMKQFHKNPEEIRESYSLNARQNVNCKLILLAVYFMAKYPEGGLSEKGQKQNGLLAGVSRLIGKKQENTPQIASEDLPLLREYEKYIVDNLMCIYEPHQMPLSALEKIRRDVEQDQITERTLQLANQKVRTNPFFLRLIGGTAFLNYTLSYRLKNTLTICLAADTVQMLDSMYEISKGLWLDISSKGQEYDTIFHINKEQYILWAAKFNFQLLLAAKFRESQESYRHVMDAADPMLSARMMEIIRREDASLYQNIQQSGKDSERNKLIKQLVAKTPVYNEIAKYMRGETDVSSLYPIENQIYNQEYNFRNRDLALSYAKTYHDEPFYRRYQVYQVLKGSLFPLGNDLRDKYPLQEKMISQFFRNLDEEKLDIAHQLKTFSLLNQVFYSDQTVKDFWNCAKKTFSDYLALRREETITAFQNAEADGRAFGLFVLGEHAEENKDAILSFSQDNSKLVKSELYHALYPQKSWEPEILAFLSSKKAAERELSIRVLSHWGAENYKELLTDALGKEKNGKVRSLLLDILSVSPQKAVGTLSLQDLIKEIHKGGKKRSLAWAYETPFVAVHKKNGEEASEEYLQAILLCYSSMGTCGLNQDAANLAAELMEPEFALYVNELFDKWLETGAEAKKRWVLYAASIHGGSEIIKKLQHQINEWPLHSRGAIAADAVQALALNPQPQALLIVDGISRKFKFKQVKAAAGKALNFAASQLGITTEELADRIVPNLGFDENMERHFNYGERSFTVTITPALEIEVFDDAGKKLKNMPAPGKRDDAEKSAEAYAAFKEMKKQMKTVISSQKMRLELALSTKREWSVDAWKKLFVENPVMHQFAIGLIWGIYEQGQLTETFRYMEDGSFNTEEEEEFELPEKGQIGLVHPVELSEESRENWKNQLTDYEITQPVEQLDRPIYRRTSEETGTKNLERFGGYILNDLSLSGKLQAMGWYRGPVEDAGVFDYYYREDPAQNLKAELHFSGSFVGGENDEVTVYDIRFNEELQNLPERYFSEIVLQITKATSSSQEKDPNWKKEMR